MYLCMYVHILWILYICWSCWQLCDHSLPLHCWSHVGSLILLVFVCMYACMWIYVCKYVRMLVHVCLYACCVAHSFHFMTNLLSIHFISWLTASGPPDFADDVHRINSKIDGSPEADRWSPSNEQEFFDLVFTPLTVSAIMPVGFMQSPHVGTPVWKAEYLFYLQVWREMHDLHLVTMFAASG